MCEDDLLLSLTLIVVQVLFQFLAKSQKQGSQESKNKQCRRVTGYWVTLLLAVTVGSEVDPAFFALWFSKMTQW